MDVRTRATTGGLPLHVAGDIENSTVMKKNLFVKLFKSLAPGRAAGGQFLPFFVVLRVLQ